MDWSVFLNLPKEEREVWSNALYNYSQEIVEKTARYTAWNFVFISIAFWLFYMPLISGVVRLTVLLVTKSPILKNRENYKRYLFSERKIESDGE